jgi:cobalt-zinc-cadmium efflux system protein
MGAGHGHGHGVTSGHVGGKYRWRLAVTFAMVAAFFLVELGAGIWSGSLSLISDAGHMAADVVALGAALVATRIATRKDTTGRRTYGSYRAEVFASGLTVLIMLGVAVFVVREAIGRIGHVPQVASGPMLIVGVIGLVINVISMLLLREGSNESLNVKGAYFEVVADAAGSVGVIVAGLLVAATGHTVWDTVIAVAIGLFVAIRALVLGRQVLAVLGQQVPEDVQLDQVIADLEGVPGVADVHDLHVWTLTSGMHVATAHLVICKDGDSQDVLTRAQELLARKHRIEHATLQTETSPTKQCHEVNW